MGSEMCIRDRGGRVSHVAVSSGLQTDLLNDSDERYSVVTNLDDKLDLPEVFRDQYDLSLIHI